MAFSNSGENLLPGYISCQGKTALSAVIRSAFLYFTWDFAAISSTSLLAAGYDGPTQNQNSYPHCNSLLRLDYVLAQTGVALACVCCWGHSSASYGISSYTIKLNLGYTLVYSSLSFAGILIHFNSSFIFGVLLSCPATSSNMSFRRKPITPPLGLSMM